MLLKQVLWFAQRNHYDLTYVTAFTRHAFLIDLLLYYGFKKTREMLNGEIMLEKPILNGDLPELKEDAIDFDRQYYPRFHDGQAVRNFAYPSDQTIIDVCSQKLL